MSFFAPWNEPAARNRTGGARATRGTARSNRRTPAAGSSVGPAEPTETDAGTAPPGYEPTAVTRWFEPAVTSEGSAPHWWDPYSAPTPMRCVRLGLLFDALAVPTPVALRALETLRTDLRDGGPGPVADCATGKTYFLVEPDSATDALAAAGPAVRHLSTHANLWLPSPRPFRDEPVWWLEPPRLSTPAAGAAVRLGDADALVPLLARSLTALTAPL